MSLGKFKSVNEKIYAKDIDINKSGKKVLNKGSFERVIGLISPVKSYFNVNDKHLFWRDDNKVCILDGNDYTKLIESQNMPFVFNGKGEYEGKIMVLSSEGKLFVEGEGQYPAPFGYPEFFGGRLFIGCGDTVHFSALFSYSDFNYADNGAGKIKLDSSDGQIKGLKAHCGNLCVITEKAVYKIALVDESTEFTVERQNLPYLKVKSDTVVKIGDKIYFISDDKLCCFNQNIEYIDSEINYKEISTKGYANGKRYIVASDKNLFYHDTLTGEEGYLDMEYCTLCGDYFIHNLDLCVYKIDFSTPDSICLGYENLDTARVKTLYSFSATCDSACKVTFYGDFGKKTYTLKAGYNYRNLNLVCVSAKITIDGLNGGGVDKIKIRYSIKGD